MKAQNWQLSWFILLFVRASEFWCRLKPSHQTFSAWALVKCSYFLKPFCKYVFQVSLSYQRKRKMNVTFTLDFFTFQILTEPCSYKDLILSSLTSLLVVIHKFKYTQKFKSPLKFVPPLNSSDCQVLSKNKNS